MLTSCEDRLQHEWLAAIHECSNLQQQLMHEKHRVEETRRKCVDIHLTLPNTERRAVLRLRVDVLKLLQLRPSCAILFFHSGSACHTTQSLQQAVSVWLSNTVHQQQQVSDWAPMLILRHLPLLVPPLQRSPSTLGGGAQAGLCSVMGVVKLVLYASIHAPHPMMWLYVATHPIKMSSGVSSSLAMINLTALGQTLAKRVCVIGQVIYIVGRRIFGRTPSAGARSTSSSSSSSSFSFATTMSVEAMSVEVLPGLPPASVPQLPVSRVVLDDEEEELVGWESYRVWRCFSHAFVEQLSDVENLSTAEVGNCDTRLELAIFMTLFSAALGEDGGLFLAVADGEIPMTFTWRTIARAAPEILLDVPASLMRSTGMVSLLPERSLRAAPPHARMAKKMAGSRRTATTTITTTAGTSYSSTEPPPPMEVLSAGLINLAAQRTLLICQAEVAPPSILHHLDTILRMATVSREDDDFEDDDDDAIMDARDRSINAPFVARADGRSARYRLTRSIIITYDGTQTKPELSQIISRGDVHLRNDAGFSRVRGDDDEDEDDDDGRTPSLHAHEDATAWLCAFGNALTPHRFMEPWMSSAAASRGCITPPRLTSRCSILLQRYFIIARQLYPTHVHPNAMESLIKMTRAHAFMRHCVAPWSCSFCGVGEACFCGVDEPIHNAPRFIFTAVMDACVAITLFDATLRTTHGTSVLHGCFLEKVKRSVEGHHRDVVRQAPFLTSGADQESSNSNSSSSSNNNNNNHHFFHDLFAQLERSMEETTPRSLG